MVILYTFVNWEITKLAMPRCVYYVLLLFLTKRCLSSGRKMQLSRREVKTVVGPHYRCQIWLEMRQFRDFVRSDFSIFWLSDLSHFRPIWPTLGPNLTSLILTRWNLCPGFGDDQVFPKPQVIILREKRRDLEPFLCH